MNDLLKERFFSLLSESSQVTIDEMKNAYEKFKEEVITLNQPEGDHLTLFRKLNLTRIELVSLRLHSQFEQGKKCHKKSVFAEGNFTP